MKLSSTRSANIHITTFIAAPVDRVFDLSRNIDLHKQSVARQKEEAVAGTRFGLIEKDESVTWKARRLFKTRLLRTKVTEMVKPQVFVDEQSQGDLKMLKHEHHFKPCNNGTIMIDLIHLEVKYGVIGKLLNQLYMAPYIRQLIEQRNKKIKEYAESEKWKNLLVQ
jgi:ligand-binding SRPBCC domain-containing protein